MMGTTNLTRQILWASALVMAASGGASARNPPVAVIAQFGLPYSASPQDTFNKPPLGQFAFNMHLCLKGELLTWNGLKFFQFILPSGETVYAAEDLYPFQGTFVRYPAGDKNCQSNAAQSTTQAKATVAGNGTTAGSLEAGLAAEKRGDWKTAFLLFEPLAKQGNADAQYNLGRMYYSGHGVPKDYTEALTWFRKAADQGNAKGQDDLGRMYYRGHGVPKDYTEALTWFRKAADQGNAEGQNNLGALYANGQGIHRDVGEALRWYRKAADQGNAVAQDNLTRLSKAIRDAQNNQTIPAYSTNRGTSGGNTASFPGNCRNYGLCGAGQPLWSPHLP